MNDSSSEGSADEDEIFKNFDEEAKMIVEKDTLPQKSADRYLLVSTTYKAWKEQNKNSLSANEENNLLVYSKSLQAKLKPPTLWSIWSMLRKTLGTRESININNYLSLKCFIKNNAKGYKPKKAYVLRWHHVMTFINEAEDNIYLAMKVILVFGICGCLRCDEIVHMKVEHVEDLGSKFLVSIYNNKNDYAGQFIIGTLFYHKVKEYISLRPSDINSNRLFIKYSEGKCFRQLIGIHKIGEIPSKIATFLGLPDPHRYTGHCFRRTSATLLSDSGASMIQIKQLGRWRSDLIAQGYVENSLHNRELIYNGVIKKKSGTIDSIPSTSTYDSVQNYTKSNTTYLKPPTSRQELHAEADGEVQTDRQENFNQSDFQLDWSDFSENFDLNNSNLIPNGVDQDLSTNMNLNNNNLNIDFVPAVDKPIQLPVTNYYNQSITPRSKLFFNKPRIKVQFNENLSPNQVSALEKRKINPQEHVEGQDFNDTHSILKENNVNFERCTFTNCVFKITKYDDSKDDRKENIF